MNLSDYQKAAGRTEQTTEEAMGNVLLADEGVGLLIKNALGLAGEAGETVEMIKKHVFHGKQLDKVKLTKELGDVLWYVSQLAAAAEIDLNDVDETNITKLKERYPEGYSHAASAARVDGG